MKPRLRYEIRCSREEKDQQKKVKDSPSIVKWVLFKPELIRFFMKVERQHRGLSREDLLIIEKLIYKDGQV